MFVRVKKSGAYQYLQIVQNERVEGRVRQQVIATLGRLDVLQKTGQLDALLASCARFAEHSAVLSAHRQGRLAAAEKVAVGPALVFERLWQELGFPQLFAPLLRDRKFEFDVEVRVQDRRYVICHNEDQARKDRADREAMLAGLETRLRQSATSLVGNKGYRKFLRTRPGGGFELDPAKIEKDARFDGKWVLQTDTELAAAECALKYKELWMVEHLFRSVKSILETRPIYHKCDETIRGHVFCSFLALVLLKELMTRLESRGGQVEWARLRDALDALEEMTVPTNGRSFVVRSQTEGDAGKALQAAGVALCPAVRLN